jgi:uncharacterized membrane protein
MGFRLRKTTASGETVPWTWKEVVQGKPFDRPSHPMTVHFPIAFYIGSLALDVLSHLGHFPWAPMAATWLILFAFAGTLMAVLTGLVDRSTMRKGTKIRGIVNLHMWIQFAAAAVFIVNLALRWSDRDIARSRPLWIALDVVGVLLVTVGADYGGRMVYKMGFRVE